MTRHLHMTDDVPHGVRRCLPSCMNKDIYSPRRCPANDLVVWHTPCHPTLLRHCITSQQTIQREAKASVYTGSSLLLLPLWLSMAEQNIESPGDSNGYQGSQEEYLELLVEMAQHAGMETVVNRISREHACGYTAYSSEQCSASLPVAALIRRCSSI